MRPLVAAARQRGNPGQPYGQPCAPASLHVSESPAAETGTHGLCAGNVAGFTEMAAYLLAVSAACHLETDVDRL